MYAVGRRCHSPEYCFHSLEKDFHSLEKCFRRVEIFLHGLELILVDVLVEVEAVVAQAM